MSDSLYRKYGASVLDPSEGMQAGLTAQKANLTSVLGGIKDLMTNQEAQYKQENTFNVQNYLKDKLQAGGLKAVLTEPINQEEIRAKFGNMVDYKAIDETIKNQTDSVKNTFINKYAAEADEIGAKTGDYIKAREHIKQGLLKEGAPNVFADTIAGEYDLRKVAEIKNIETQFQQGLAASTANAFNAGRQGYQAMKAAAEADINKVAPHKRAEFAKIINANINDYSEPSKYDELASKSAIATYDDETNQLAKVMADNLQQRNDQKLTVSSTNSSSMGSEGGSRSGGRSSKSSSGGGFDSKTGQPSPSMAIILGDKVNNWFEKFSGTSDSVVIKGLHKDIADNVGDEGIAADILKQSFDYAYKGDGKFGNDLSKPDLKLMKERAGILIQQYNEGNNKTSSVSTSRSNSTSRGGNISFTNSDALTKFIAERQKGRQEFTSSLMEAARNNKLGVTDYDGVKRLIDARINSQAAPPTAAPTTQNIMNIQSAVTSPIPAKHGGVPNGSVPTTPAATARVNNFMKENNIQDHKSGQAGNESAKDRLARYTREDVAKNNPPAPQPSTPTLSRYEQDKLEREEAYNRLSNRLKPKPKVDPHEGQIEVIHPKRGRVWVPVGTDLERFKLRLYKK